MIASRSFIMHVGADRSKQRFLKNGVPQGSVLAPLLFNLHTSDLPKTQSKKYIYADDIALMISGENSVPSNNLSEDLDNEPLLQQLETKDKHWENCVYQLPPST